MAREAGQRMGQGGGVKQGGAWGVLICFALTRGQRRRGGGHAADRRCGLDPASRSRGWAVGLPKLDVVTAAVLGRAAPAAAALLGWGERAGVGWRREKENESLCCVMRGSGG